MNDNYRFCWASFLVGLVPVVILSSLLMITVVRQYRDYQGEMTTLIPTIELTDSEGQELEAAREAWARKDYAKLNAWVDSLRKKGKYGILPCLPESYSIYFDTDIVFVEKIGRCVLLPPKKSK